MIDSPGDKIMRDVYHVIAHGFMNDETFLGLEDVLDALRDLDVDTVVRAMYVMVYAGGITWDNACGWRCEPDFVWPVDREWSEL